ncbi:hypothetical protein [Desulfosediminicola flagellatus]|uniref:hypothetical protein n=1 Tax=Desulfosediminicola flagellatus TaxID=2569541 RepID=UPI0012947EDE|nr:hypothetical protein [Desulfosediminicola flagellatus]
MNVCPSLVSGLTHTILELAAENLEQTTGSPNKGYTTAHNNAGQAVVIVAKLED